jgi:hypothetical protein
MQQALTLKNTGLACPNAARSVSKSSILTLLLSSKSTWAQRPAFDAHVSSNLARTISKSSTVMFPSLLASTLQYLVQDIDLHRPSTKAESATQEADLSVPVTHDDMPNKT